MSAGVGHNSGAKPPMAADTLRSAVDRIERLAEERKGLGDDIRDIYVELKSNGFDPKIVRQVIRLRAQDADTAAEEAMLRESYIAALGG